MRAREHTVRVSIRNSIRELAVLSAALDEFGIGYGVPGEALVDLQVALDEIASNIIKYAWPDGGKHELTMRMTVRPHQVEIELIDDGTAFDPRSAPAPERAAPGRRRRPGGAGIPMVKQLMDHIEYVRTDGRNHMILRKRCATSVAPEEK